MAREYVEKNTAEMVRCLKELVAIPGIFEDAPSKGAPFGKNIQKSLEYVLRMGQQMGFQVKNYDGYAGEITAGEGNRMIGILCHTDVVSAGEGWNTDPFDPVEKDGKLYGRGSADMKGAVAAFTVAAHRYAVENGKNFAGAVYVAGVVHEECFEGVAARKISEKVKPDYVVIGEASEMNLKVGQRGRAEIVVETFGVPAHSANPEKGVNAVYKMCEAIQAIREIEPPVQDKLGKGILELTDVKSSPYPGASVVPEYCRATYDRRLLVGETKESVLQPIIEKMEELKKKDPQFSYKVSYAVGKEECYTGEKIQGERFFPGWLFGAEEEWVAKIKSELEKEGFSPEVTTYNFCTNGSHYAGEAGIRTIGMGPARENLAHTIDEYAEVEDLTNVFRCYVGIMKALLG